ncbi:MAG: hypothetical protein KDC99_18765 [Cyclobacteriaceae bacterium]|nr:hypothetical protein [Cyclobacteriaceae bacterium]
MKVAGLSKVFTNTEVEDLPLPEVPPHTHDGQNSQALAPDSVDTVQIKSGAVVGESIADEAVGSTKLIPDSVLTEHLNALAVTEEKLAAAAVATGKIKDGAVNAQKLIQSEAVITVAAQIADATILSAHIGTGIIQNAHLANAIVTNAKIVDGTIQTAKIGDAQITNAKIGLAAVDNANIANLAVTSAKIASAAVGSAQIGAAAILTAHINDLAVTEAKILSLTAAKITAGQFNLTSTGYLSAPYGGLKFGYLRDIGGVHIYGIQAGPGHGLMLDDGANAYARMWVDDSGSRPLVIDTTLTDRFFIKASSGNDIVRFYGNNAVSGGFVDVRTSFRIGTDEPSSPTTGEMYFDTSPSGMGAGGRLMIYNGFSWHGVAWFDDI